MATKIYSGKDPISSAQIFLVEEGKIYMRKYSISSEELKNIDPEGLRIIDNTKNFKGKQANSSEQIGTVSKKNIYKGREINPSHQIGVIDGDRLKDDEFVKIIYLLAKKNNLL